MNQQQNLFYSYLPQGQPQGKLQVVLCAIEFQMYQQVEAGNETYAKQNHNKKKQFIADTHFGMNSLQTSGYSTLPYSTT